MNLTKLLATTAIAGLALAAQPAAAQPAATKNIKIGMVNLSLCCAYFVGMDAAVKDEASHFPNVKILSTDAKGDVAKLTADVDDLLNQKVDALIISGAWIEAAPAALEAINRAKVPVVMVDRQLKGGERTAWVGPDNRAIGEGVGDYINKRLNGQGKVAIIRGGPADNTIGSNRSDGVKAKLEGTKIQTVVAPGWGKWSADGGFTQMEDLLSKNADLNAVFCENDSMCLGAQKAIADAGKSKQIFIASVDGEMGTLKEIMREDSNYGVTGRNSSDQIGRAGFNRAMAIIAGGVPKKDTALPSPIITKDNAVKYYDANSRF
ncbi:sugar ABC transporter substrate-binding protein [Bosea caraganae]|uniref:Sugar ABC transporter substrate-binding protein n=1 Tax=Bosea caraganae TaxID=2763117 RepID=A0A370L172_9HYPH|nr:substrate-binding domain-containing protein [Bosea caraganae]RDJ21302.1 sugar ABC transporter substrate-binding protein [Bosea caraganae]RDJ26442.1 sugar ABC transporter substrate-binding protein [Bosea caraganae]